MAVNNGIYRASQHLHELDAYLELGMKKDCLRVAKELLQHETVTPYVFGEVIQAVLVQADNLRCWRSSIESVHSKFSKKQQRIVRNAMFYFYVSLPDFGTAFLYMPAKPQSAPELLFSMWTLLNLNYLEACDRLSRRIYRFCKRTHCEFEQSCCWEALASYFARKGQLGLAEQFWDGGTGFKWFQENAWEGLTKLYVFRARQQIATALAVVSKSKPEWDPSLPRNEDLRKTASLKRFARLKATLDRALPAEELWRFGQKRQC